MEALNFLRLIERQGKNGVVVQYRPAHSHYRQGSTSQVIPLWLISSQETVWNKPPDLLL